MVRKYPRRLFPLGFTKTIERAMAASDLAITKPGGLTTSECLAVGLPLIVVSPYPARRNGTPISFWRTAPHSRPANRRPSRTESINCCANPGCSGHCERTPLALGNLPLHARCWISFWLAITVYYNESVPRAFASPKERIASIVLEESMNTTNHATR